MARTSTQGAALLSVANLSFNLLAFLAEHDIRGGLRDQLARFYNLISTMSGFLLVYFSEEGYASSNDDKMSRVAGLIIDFFVESGDVLVDAFDKFIISKQHTTSTNSTGTADEDDEPLAPNDDPAAAIGCSDLAEQLESIVSYIEVDDEYSRILKNEIKRGMKNIQITPRYLEYELPHVKGLGLYARLMFDRVTQEEGTKRRLNVIAITGEGGTGKTTLARFLYVCFRYCGKRCGWISVSKAYVMRDLLLSLLKDIMVITEEIHEMEERELKNQLWKQLKGRQYIIVIDDVWDTQAWNDLKDLFPDDGNRSRILITTRFPRVASYATTTTPGGKRSFPLITKKKKKRRSFPLPDDLFQIDVGFDNDFMETFEDHHYDGYTEEILEYDCFQLKPLKQDASWMLFCDFYFKKKWPYVDRLEMEAHGRRIVRSCCGRSLVISVVAHILRFIDGGDDDGSSWSSIASQINEGLSGDHDQQMDILALCFHRLAPTVQACFLCLGVFPEDSEISLKQVLELWMAEGIMEMPIPQIHGAGFFIEDVAEYYLQLLLDLRLILVTKTRIDGGPKSIRIHDTLRDLCIHLSKEDGFLEVHTGKDHSSIHDILRDLCIHLSKEDGFLEVHTGKDDSSTGTDDHQTKAKRLSILGNCREYVYNSIDSSSSSSCSHVRSFSCFSQDTQTFSKQDWKSFFQHFRLLRVLNLGNQEAQSKLDDSIGELIHLRYLKVNPAKNISLPISAIFNLWNLRILDLRKASLSKLPVEIWKMRRLRHLHLNGRSRLPKAGIEDQLPNLIVLSYISNDPRGAIRIAEKAPNLRKLGLNGYRCVTTEEEEATFSLRNLLSLKFAGECTFIEKITLPETIIKITVKKALLQSNAIEMFGKLPNLQILKLQTNFDNDKLEILGEDSFPKLWLLQLANSNIVALILDKGAMPKLRNVILSSCSQLLRLPDELFHMSTIERFELNWCSKELSDSFPNELNLRVYPPPMDGDG